MMRTIGGDYGNMPLRLFGCLRLDNSSSCLVPSSGVPGGRPRGLIGLLFTLEEMVTDGAVAGVFPDREEGELIALVPAINLEREERKSTPRQCKPVMEKGTECKTRQQ